MVVDPRVNGLKIGRSVESDRRGADIRYSGVIVVWLGQRHLNTLELYFSLVEVQAERQANGLTCIVCS